MAALEFRDLAQLVNFSGTTFIEPVPTKTKEGRWALHQGTNRVHVSSYPFHVLYFNAAATVEDIKRALTQTSEFVDRHVVFPPTIAKRFDGSDVEITRLLKRTKGAWGTREYLVSFIRNEIQVYLKRIAEHAPADYIHPRIETPAGFDRRIPNPLLSFLQDPKPDSMGGGLGIVLAEPGQGKTYMSQYLVSEIAKDERGLVPLMVDSSQWETMPLEDQGSLSKTIAHSFEHFGATIGWLDGHEDEFLRATLKADVFRIVFDGFDEYILRNSDVQPMEVLDTLANLASTTDTRIVITSRTSFWRTNLSDTEVDAFLERSGSLLYSIQPFDLEHAKNYFARRFGRRKKPLDTAVRVYGSLRKGNEDIVGRGFVLPLVADLADRGEVSQLITDEIERPLFWLAERLCEREQERQQLPFGFEQQLSVLRTFAVEVAEGAKPSSALLEISMEMARPGPDLAWIRPTLEKLKSHPLIGRDSADDIWRFRQNQVRVLLLAQQIVEWGGSEIERFLEKARMDPESLQDLGAMIVNMVVKYRHQDGVISELHRIVEAASPSVAERLNRLTAADDGSRLAGVISITAVEQMMPKQGGSTRRERRDLLLRLCGPNAVRGVSFSGTIARFDFSATRFDACRFERVAWANCRFDDETTFANCHFVGGIPPAHCEGFGGVKTEGCYFDEEAEAMFSGIRIREGRKTYGLEDLRADIDSVLRKFAFKGGTGLKTVSASSLIKGTISVSPHRDEIVETLKRIVFEEHHISGNATSGFHIAENAREAFKFYASNNVLTGPLRDAFEKLKHSLNLG